MKKSRSHRKGRAPGSDSERSQNAGSSKLSRDLCTPDPLERNTSSTSSHGTHRSQLVDLVVEDHKAEEEERAQAQREFGSAWAESETRRFS